MSQPIDLDSLKEQYLNTLEIVTVCPYCGDLIEGRRIGCCGESSAHFEEMYDNGEEYFSKSEFDFYFKCWLESQSEIEESRREDDPMYLSKAYTEAKLTED